MPRRRAPQGAATDPSYWECAKRPMQVLSLVLPICVANEVLLAVGLARLDGTTLTNRAHEGILRLFSALGVDGSQVGLPSLSIPAIAIVVVLVLWQVLSRQPWKVSWPVSAGMVGESLLASIPLYMAGIIIGLTLAFAAQPEGGATSLTSGARVLDWPGRLGLSLGAGLYEELVFRLALVSLLHGALHDLCRVPDRTATWIAVGAAAVAFMLYHPIRDASGGLVVRDAFFLLVAGFWFGTLFVTRGFGIAVGAHAAYDILALATLPPAIAATG
ncbi:MAG: CPBP family intramembrane metalloprotease [Planctomycetota bacterium]|nr:CPBP family intramembrane metalloprotease [Planctomycetota bacterium]